MSAGLYWLIYIVAVDSICYKFIIVDCNILGHLSNSLLDVF